MVLFIIYIKIIAHNFTHTMNLVNELLIQSNYLQVQINLEVIYVMICKLNLGVRKLQFEFMISNSIHRLQ